MWPYPSTHVGTPSHLGHMDRVAATMPSQAHAGAAQEAPDIGQWEGQDVPLVRPSSCNVKGGISSSRRYLPAYLPQFGHLFQVPGLTHVLHSVDLQAWDCRKACRLLQSNALSYTDCSASPLCFGSAITLFPPCGPPQVLCCSSQYESSEGAEYCGFRVVLQWLKTSPQYDRVCFLIDNYQVQCTLAITIRMADNNEPFPPEAPLWAKMLCSLLDDLPEQCVVRCAWITGHAGLTGNGVSDYFSTWAAHTLTWHRYLTLPPSLVRSRPVLPPAPWPASSPFCLL